jgi:hypothetical protein
MESTKSSPSSMREVVKSPLTEEERRQRRLAKYARYRASENGRARDRRHNAERAANGKAREYREAHRAEHAVHNRAYRARKKAYLDALWADAPGIAVEL